MLTLHGYLKCQTCRKAVLWLEEHGLKHRFIDITTEPPSKATLEKIVAQDKPVAYQVKHLFNTSGQDYREQDIAAKRKTMSDAEQLELLAGNGRLIKRPIVSDGTTFTVGFDPDLFERVWGQG